MDALGEDVLLLAIRDDGLIVGTERLSYALMGAELVGLAASGRVNIADGRIVVQHLALTGDPELDAALQSLIQAARPPTAKHWVSRPRRGIRDAYLARLTAAGVITPEQGLLRTRWRVSQPDRVSHLIARLNAVATSDGPVDITDAAFGGLVHAAAIDRSLYPGWGGRRQRDRLAQVAKGNVAVTAANQAASSAASAASMAASQAAMQAATEAATQAAVQAATQAAISAAAAAAASADTGGHEHH